MRIRLSVLGGQLLDIDVTIGHADQVDDRPITFGFNRNDQVEIAADQAERTAFGPPD